MPTRDGKVLVGRCMNLGDVRGLHSGRAAVVCGSGPSLRFVDPRLYKHVVITVNDAFSKLRRAPYYVSCDVSMVGHLHWKQVLKSETVVAVPYDTWKFNQAGTMAGVHPNRVINFERHDHSRGQRMPETDDKLIRGVSSTHVAVHLAAVMGCSPIYLIGCDSRCESGKKYYWEFKNQPKGGTKNGFATFHLSEMKRIGKELASHLYDPWYRKDGTPCGGTIVEWQEIRKANPNLKIIDASGLRGGGALAATGVFPAADILDVMGRRR